MLQAQNLIKNYMLQFDFMPQTQEVLYAISLVLFDPCIVLQIRFHFQILKSLFFNQTLKHDNSLESFL